MEALTTLGKKLQGYTTEAKTRFDRVQALVQNPEVTDEQMAEIKTLNQEIADFQGKAAEVKATLESIQQVNGAGAKLQQDQDFLDQSAGGLNFGNGVDVDAIYRSGASTFETDRRGRAVKMLEENGEGILGAKAWGAIHQKNYERDLVTYLRHKANESLHMVPQDAIKALQEGQDSAGGFTVPVDFINRIIEKRPTPTRIADNTQRITTAKDRVVMPKVNYASATDDANGNIYTTGIRVSFAGENPTSSAIRVTEPVFGQVEIPIYTAMMSMPITKDLLEDSGIDLMSWASGKFRETIDLLYDNMVLNGTGVSQPEGILKNADVTTNHYTAASSDGSTIIADGIRKTCTSLPEQYIDGAKWALNRTNTYQALDLLKDGVGRYILQTGVNEFGHGEGLPPNIAGFPFMFSQFMPNIGANTYPMIFGNWQGYILAERIGFTLDVARELLIEQNQILLVGRVRFGGKVAEGWRFQVAKIATS